MTFAQPFKDYEILERIGAGAMGTVFKARQKRLDRIVALKVLKPSLARNTKFVERLRREARIVASLNHPDIVAGYDLGEEGGYHFFVMEFVEGRSLATLLREWGSFPEAQVLDVAIRVASALDHAFKKGVIHRDVKPGNILIDRDGRAKLTDMGLAKAPEDVTITQEGATVGTPQYISPEQARDPAKADVRSDLYSLGATMFHMCTGQPPFVGGTLANVIHGVIHDRAPSVSSINPAVSDGLALVIKKLLAKDPALRYQTPAELLADLQRVQRAERPQVDEGALAADDAGPRPRLSGRRLAGLGLAAAVVAAVAVLVVWPREPAARPPAPEPTEQFVARARARVMAAEGWRDKLRSLQQAAADAGDEATRRAIADLRAGVLIPWQDALVRFVRGRRAEVAAIVVEPEHWHDPARELRNRLVDGIERTFGIRRPELPADLAQVLEAELEQLDAEVAAQVVARDQNLLEAFRGHLQGEVTKAWLAALEQSDFAGAERAVLAGGDAFFGRDGRPRREQLAADTAQRAAAIEQQVVQGAVAQIERAEDKVAADLQQAARDAFAELRGLLKDDFDPQLLQQRFLAWRRGLAERYPESRAFRSGRDPWSSIHDAEQVFRVGLAAAQAAADRRRLQADVQLALAALHADGDATQEVRWLRERSDDPALTPLRERWAALFDDAHAAREWLLGALAVKFGGGTVTVSDPTAVGRTLRIGIRRDDGGRLELVERDGPRGRRLSLAAVRTSELIEQAPPPAGAAAVVDAIDRGLALWLYCASETSAAGKRVPPKDMAWFGEHVVHAMRAMLVQRLGNEAEAREALAQLRRQHKDMAPVDLRDALQSFDAKFGQSAVALASAQVLNDLRTHLRVSEHRASVLDSLRGAVPAGLQVTVDDDDRARVTCDPVRATDLPLGAGWQRHEQHLLFTVADVRLEQSRTHALVLADGLSTEHGVTFTGSLTFAAQGSKPRLYLLEVHGVGVALGLTAAGEPFAVVLPVEDLARDKAMQRALEQELDLLVEPRANGPAVVVGARHALRVEVRVQAKRLEAQVRLDGVEIARGNVGRPARIAARIALMPLQPLTLWQAVVEGQP